MTSTNMEASLILSDRRKQIYLLGANVLFGVHVFAILSNVAGWLVPGFFFAYLAIMLASIVSELYFGYCVLTKLEFGLRKKVEPNLVFNTSCIKHYAFKFFKIGKPAQLNGTTAKTRGYSFLILLLSLLSIGLMYKFVILRLIS